MSKKELYIILIYLTGLLVVGNIMFYIVYIHLFYNSIIIKKEWILKSFFYISIIKFINPVFGEGFNHNIWFIILIINFFLLLTYRNTSLQKIEIKYYIMLIIFLLLSLIVSDYEFIAITKVLTLIVIAFVYFQSSNYIETYEFNKFIYDFSNLFLLISSIFLLIPQGYYINTLFMGIMGHSQSIGLYIVPLLIYQTIYTHIYKKNIFYIISILGFIQLLATFSRTALVSFLIPLILFFIFNSTKKLSIKKIVVMLISTIIFATTIVQNYDYVESKFLKYAFKQFNNQNFQYDKNLNVLSSREGLITESLNNFNEHPFMGIGFGLQFENNKIRLDEKHYLKYIPGTEIPFNQSIEKGNLYLSVLEETGIIGFSFFMLVIFSIFIQLKNISYLVFPYISILFTFMGESTLFAPGGIGNWQLILIIIFLSIYKKRTRIND